MKYAQGLVFVKRVRVDGATSRMLTDIQRELLRLGGLGSTGGNELISSSRVTPHFETFGCTAYRLPGEEAFPVSTRP